MNNVEKSKQLTAEQIEVMAAFLEGKEIEVQEKSGNSANEIWLPEPAPTWDWHNFNYRVQPEDRFVPYKSAEEFLAAQKEHGPYIRRFNDYHLVDHINPFGVCTSRYNNYLTPYPALYRNFVWQDGTPCGREVGK